MFKLRALLTMLAFLPTMALAASSITMHRDPGCPCCMKWAAQVQRAFGRRVQVIDDERRSQLQSRSGISGRLGSCHTALIDGYVFEGHVPIADMKRFLAQKPKGFRGLAVAGMPMGSPGMEMPAGHKQAFDVIAFGPSGQRVFARHAQGH
jgi:hypothetical protein